MPRSRRPDPADDEDEDWDDDELPEGVYYDDAEDEDPDSYTVKCPYCGHAVHEDAQFCVRCENYISREDSPHGGRPWWIWVCLVLALGAAVFWIMP